MKTPLPSLCAKFLPLLTSLIALARLQADPPIVPAVVKEDFSSLTEGTLPDEIMVIEGAFTIVTEGGNKMLQLGIEPLTEGGVLLGKSLKRGGTVKAKVRASSKRRSFPRFSVGIGGTSGYRCRIAPAEKLMEINKEDTRLAKADFTWKSEAWYWVEISVVPAQAEGKWSIEGRCWEDGQPRPETPQVGHTATEPPPNGKASVWGAPFSEKPIFFDDIEITPAK